MQVVFLKEVPSPGGVVGVRAGWHLPDWGGRSPFYATRGKMAEMDM